MPIREIRFTVWQFVRLMVHLEERRDAQQNNTQLGPRADEAALWAAWAGVWTPLDQELARLAESDAAAYADMMMNQDVVIEDVPAALAATAKAALEAVMAEMDSAIEAATTKTDGDEDLLDSLKFERRELRQLTRKLGRQV